MLRLYPGESGGGAAGDDNADEGAQTGPQDGEEEPKAGEGTEEESTAPGPDDESETEEETDDEGELDDETIETLSEAYRERIMKSKAVSDLVNQQIRREVERQVSQRVRGAETETRSEDLASRGRRTAQAVVDLASAVQTEFVKASKGENFKSDVLTPEIMTQRVGEYGTAIAAYISTQFDSAIEEGWDSIFEDAGLPAMSDEQAGELAEMVETFRRMEGDTRQAANAKPYFFTRLFKTLVELGRADGIAKEQSRQSKAKTATEKIVGKSAVAAAKAKLAKEKAPPRTGKSTPAVTGDPLDAYDKAVAAGDKDRAQSIVDQLAKQGWFSGTA